ncbi:hypothetical protein ACIRLA_02295 [Streptomyces sp. NPDC102364]|uniref:hypothetical protein n=1 Tax=Streptomyces sp. NPDC102364 TaxID=3366161 RepID=UPI00381C76F4
MRAAPADAEAAAVLAQWVATEQDVTLDATYLDLTGADLSGADLGCALFCPATARGVVLAEADEFVRRMTLGNPTVAKP